MELSFVEGNVHLRVDDIIYIATSRHKNVFYTAGETYSIYKKMDELEAELAGIIWKEVKVGMGFDRGS